MSHVVYGLEDPRDHMYHYIGITDDVYARFNQHVTGSVGNIEKNGWIWECRQANIMILMREIQRVESFEEAQKRERFWIGYYLHLGHPLHNLAVAKGVEREQMALERRLKRLEERLERLEGKPTEEKIPETQKILETQQTFHKGIDLQEVAAAWKNGHQSIDKISAILGLSPWQARGCISRARVQGLI